MPCIGKKKCNGRRNGVYKIQLNLGLVDLLTGRKAIENKWVFKIKWKLNETIEMYKAHLVIKVCNRMV